MRLLTTRFAGARTSLGRARVAAFGGVSSLVSSAARATRSGPAAVNKARGSVTALPPRVSQEREGTL